MDYAPHSVGRLFHALGAATENAVTKPTVGAGDNVVPICCSA